ncbi:zinc finger CONSTANS-LIKE 6 isoform X1 [Olea europaea subsp. europaea]|uniref:Zinc finger CONSTANS-LIKE 6 isoform X1 n=1 Tax=Olea europaea subsp. europaea TaxID=158383 RepID=A0A8S0RR69_OLEEU|nr:zinc finger CONSTANS-LIKE 6 isoform X1 [Olea europaea subsp. europaea]
MYAETGLMLPYLPQEIQQFDDFYSSQKPNGSLGNLIQTSTISDYNLGGEGDLFKAPEPVIEELMMGLDPISAAISMISCGEDVIFPQAMSVSDIESSIKNGQLLSEVFYECKKDLLEKEAYEMPLSELLDIKIPILKADEKLISEGQFQKSVSSSCLKSMEMHQAPLRQNFVDFPGMDFGAVYGMRRAFSEGDIETLGNGNTSVVGQPKIISSCPSEDRKEKLSRYRSKKSKRNFGRKIKYACRKALADSQPRVRGRFAKTE